MDQIEYVVGDEKILEKSAMVCAWGPFDERVIQFCEVLSRMLLAINNASLYPDLITFAFWLRKKNVQKISRQYADMADCLGRGLVFHIAPGNTPLAFAWSLATGLLTGNTNIIRLPSRRFEQADIFCAVLRDALLEDPVLSERLCLIRYPHNKSITDRLSSKCHMRIIWGGDDTVSIIRQSPLPPRAKEIAFANRFSICLIDADKYLSNCDPRKTAHNFYIDTYLTDQNACSSPRIIFWLGEKRVQAKKVFWDALQTEINDYVIAPVTTVNKLLTFCKFAAENECQLSIGSDYRIMRISVKSPNAALLDNIGNSGYFYECDISTASEVLTLCSWELQTLSYIGLDGNALHEIVLSQAPAGVDRIVPTGRTMDFSFIWDGSDIVRELTRIVSKT